MERSRHFSRFCITTIQQAIIFINTSVTTSNFTRITMLGFPSLPNAALNFYKKRSSAEEYFKGDTHRQVKQYGGHTILLSFRKKLRYSKI